MKQLILLISLMSAFVFHTDAQESNRIIQSQAFENAIQQSPQVQLIDVRTPVEYQSGHIAHAINFDVHGAFFEQQIQSLDRKKPVYAYCKSGKRSAQAAQILEAKGFNVIELKGGIKQWQQDKMPLTAPQIGVSNSPQKRTLEKAIENGKLTIVHFDATWCADCEKTNTVINKFVSRKDNSAQQLSIDADNNPELVKELDIHELPTLLIYRHGQKISQHSGLINKRFLKQAISDKKIEN